jgi:hypothetical protein
MLQIDHNVASIGRLWFFYLFGSSDQTNNANEISITMLSKFHEAVSSLHMYINAEINKVTNSNLE